MGADCHHHTPHAGLSATARQAAIDAAAGRCESDGERMTPPRRRVLDLLLAAGEPVKAYDLIARFGEEGQAAKPPTVYRALEFLERRGLVHRIASISAYVACSGGDQAHSAAFLICDCCGAAQEVSPPPGSTFSLAADQAGYRIDRTTIEGHGRCPACLTAAAP